MGAEEDCRSKCRPDRSFRLQTQINGWIVGEDGTILSDILLVIGQLKLLRVQTIFLGVYALDK